MYVFYGMNTDKGLEARYWVLGKVLGKAFGMKRTIQLWLVLKRTFGLEVYLFTHKHPRSDTHKLFPGSVGTSSQCAGKTSNCSHHTPSFRHHISHTLSKQVDLQYSGVPHVGVSHHTVYIKYLV